MNTEVTNRFNMTASQIRKTFLEFFESKQHHIVPSAPIVVKNDPTLMFTNAGMNQFKDYFLGNKPAPWPRVADTQKCLRVSGKHNDLEEVGVDTYHHTMFEMLGNWSFGDYFKKEAIEWSWELLTSVYGIPKDRLYVTVFEGDAAEGLPADHEAAMEWRRWINEERILKGNKKDNFWEMGDTGPCGPCTEIHIDCRPNSERNQVDGRSLVNADHPQVIEIWNNVFMQFNRVWSDKKSFDEWTAANPQAAKEERARKVIAFTKLDPLPARHVDTGMGFERLVRVLQGKQSNYDTDVFTPLIREIEKITGKSYDAVATPAQKEAWDVAVAIRVNADHIRAISFTIADGQLPSNTGAGYVIRRILRRAVRYYYSSLGYQQPMLCQLVPALADQFADVFFELKKQEAFVARVIREEEEAFLRTLEKGLKRMEDIVVNTTGTVPGQEAFELYDTYGFPFDLTRLIAAEKGLKVDQLEFDAAMQKQKDRSRAATAMDAGDWVVLKEGSSEFVGYDSLETQAEVLRYRKVKAKGKEIYQVVLDKTPFYAESGGQVGDTGTLEINGNSIPVIDTRKENDLIIHFVEKMPENAEGTVDARVNTLKRRDTAVHHSATHLLHAALRKVLGVHVAQKGSLVNSDYLRFDFSHFARMTNEEIRAVEALVNEKIRENLPVIVRYMPKEEALKTGAMALFGEKYGDVVRVVTIDPKYSIELCGGTHVGATGELGFFKIVSEGAVAAGVRRIEAISGAAAEEYIAQQLQVLDVVKEQLKQPKDLAKAIASLAEEAAQLKKQLEKQELAQLKAMTEDLSKKAEAVNGYHFLGEVVTVSSADALKKLAFDLKAAIEKPVLVLAAAINGKANVVLLFDDAVVEEKGLDAGAVIKKNIAPLIKGGGGGQKTLATAGGQDSSSLQQVIAAVRALI